eukprot:3696342-Rhodomonas_salina.1
MPRIGLPGSGGVPEPHTDQKSNAPVCASSSSSPQAPSRSDSPGSDNANSSIQASLSSSNRSQNSTVHGHWHGPDSLAMISVPAYDKVIALATLGEIKAQSPSPCTLEVAPCETVFFLQCALPVARQVQANLASCKPDWSIFCGTFAAIELCPTSNPGAPARSGSKVQPVTSKEMRSLLPRYGSGRFFSEVWGLFVAQLARVHEPPDVREEAGDGTADSQSMAGGCNGNQPAHPAWSNDDELVLHLDVPGAMTADSGGRWSGSLLSVERVSAEPPLDLASFITKLKAEAGRLI